MSVSLLLPSYALQNKDALEENTTGRPRPKSPTGKARLT